MTTSYGGFLQNDRSTPPAPPPPPPQLLPPWLTLSSPSSVRAPLEIRESPPVSEIAYCCRDMEDNRRAWAANRNESSRRLYRFELQLESEKAFRRKEKAEDTERRIDALRAEQRVALDRIEAECREQLAALRKEAEAKEQKLAEQWAAKHSRLTKFLDQMGCARQQA